MNTATAPAPQRDTDPLGFIYHPLFKHGWKPGEIDALELADVAHLFGNGPKAPQLTDTDAFRRALEAHRRARAET